MESKLIGEEEEKKQFLLTGGAEKDGQKNQKAKMKQIPVYWQFSYGTIDIPDLQAQKQDQKSSPSSSDDQGNDKKEKQKKTSISVEASPEYVKQVQNQGNSSSAPESPDVIKKSQNASIEEEQMALAIQQSIQDQFKNIEKKPQPADKKKDEQEKKMGAKDPVKKDQKQKNEPAPKVKQEQQKEKNENKKVQQVKEKPNAAVAAAAGQEQKKKAEDENAQKKKQQEQKAAKKKKDRQLQDKKRKQRERQILKSQEIAHVKLKCGGHAYVPGNTLKQQISLHIKTFFGIRRKFTFRVNIQDRVETLKQMLMAADQTGELKHYQDIRLYYVMGNINELVLSKTFEMLNIPHNAQLILSGTKTFEWSSKKKGPNINVSHNNLTASKIKEVTHQSILTTIGFSSGSHYWEISLDTYVDIEDIFVGICLENNALNKNPYEINTFWGFVPAAAKKFQPGAVPGAKSIISDFGPMCQIKDVIGISLDFNEVDKTGTLSFYRNRQKIGVAFNKIPANTYYPAICLYYGESQVSLNPFAKIPIK